MDVDGPDKMDDRHHPSIDLHLLSLWGMSRTTTGCFLRLKPSWQTCSLFPHCRILVYIQWHVRSQAPVLKMKPNVAWSIENKREAKTRNGSIKWHQAFTGKQRKVYSMAFVFAHCHAASRIRAAFEKRGMLSWLAASKPSCFQIEAVSLRAASC